MSTGTVQSAKVTIVKDLRKDILALSFVNDSGGELFSGQEVTLKTDGTIDKRDAGTELPLGTVKIGAVDSERVVVYTVFKHSVKGIATGGALDAGVYVKPNGTLDSSNRPQYVAIGDEEYALGLTITSALEDAEILVGIMESPVLTPAGA